MAQYKLFKHSIELAEGKYQNLVNDKGNYNSLKQCVGTKYGISAKFYEKIIKRPPTIEDMQNITQDKAHQLFKKYFWDKLQADSIKNQSIAEILVDHAINSNPRTTTKIIQKVLNNSFNKKLLIDGKLGVKTLEAINSVEDNKKLFLKIAIARLKYYRRLKDYKYFSNLWNNRVLILSKKFNINLKEYLKKKKY